MPDLLSQEEFFEGFSIPRNQEMMRIFKDLKLVEHLGSGVPRILEAYPKECFKFTENFLRMTFPNTWDLSEDEDAPQEEQVTQEGQDTMQANDQVTDQVTDQVIKLISTIRGEISRPDIMENLQLKHTATFRQNYLQPAIEAGLIEMTQPDSPNSPTQKYRLTEKGKILQKLLKR